MQGKQKKTLREGERIREARQEVKRGRLEVEEIKAERCEAKSFSPRPSGTVALISSPSEPARCSDWWHLSRKKRRTRSSWRTLWVFFCGSQLKTQCAQSVVRVKTVQTRPWILNSVPWRYWINEWERREKFLKCDLIKRVLPHNLGKAHCLDQYAGC